MGLDHPDHIFGTILDVYAEAGSTRTNDVIDNSRPCDCIRKLCGSSHITPKFVTHIYIYIYIYIYNIIYIYTLICFSLYNHIIVMFWEFQIMSCYKKVIFFLLYKITH